MFKKIAMTMAAVVLITILAAPLIMFSNTQTPPAGMQLLIVPITNQESMITDEISLKDVQSRLYTFLEGYDNFRVLPTYLYNQINEINPEFFQSSPQLITNLAAIGKELSAEMVIYPSYIKEDGIIYMRSLVINTITGQVDPDLSFNTICADSDISYLELALAYKLFYFTNPDLQSRITQPIFNALYGKYTEALSNYHEYTPTGYEEAMSILTDAMTMESVNATLSGLYFASKLRLMNYRHCIFNENQEQEYDRILQSINTSIRISGHAFFPNLALGIYYRDMKMWQLCASAAEKLLYLNGESSEVLCLAGDLYNPGYFPENSNPQLGMEYYSSSIQSDPGWNVPYTSRGLVLKSNGEFDSAIISYQQSLQINSDDVISLNNLGALYILIGQPCQAYDYLERAIGLEPDSPYIKINMALSLEASGNTNQAQTLWQQLAAIDLPERFAELVSSRLVPYIN